MPEEKEKPMLMFYKTKVFMPFLMMSLRAYLVG
ncbi:hypothetical protein BN440_1219 [Erwinia amylovora MR1]|nr:hypothetical protein BN440_1219 [Erwinia amylovora MR1]